MNCIEFKNWISEIDAHDQTTAQEAQSHVAVRSKCEKIYALDQAIERKFRETMGEIDPPDDLHSRIKRDLPFKAVKNQKPAVRWRMVAPALAAAAVVLIVFVIFPGGSIRDLDHIGTLAMANHLEDRSNMAFRAGEINDVAGWFVKQIGFAAAPPKKLEQGLIFQGGRQCKLGTKKAAYLYYKKDGKKCSLFIINSDDLNFKLTRNKQYVVDIKNHDVTVWAEDGLVYAMVI